MKEEKMRVETERRRRRRRMNRDEWRDGNWATFASVAVCVLQIFLRFSLGQGYVGSLTAANYAASQALQRCFFSLHHL